MRVWISARWPGRPAYWSQARALNLRVSIAIFYFNLIFSNFKFLHVTLVTFFGAMAFLMTSVCVCLNSCLTFLSNVYLQTLEIDLFFLVLSA